MASLEYERLTKGDSIMKSRMLIGLCASSSNYDTVGQRLMRKMRQERVKAAQAAAQTIKSVSALGSTMARAEWEGLRYRLFGMEHYVDSSECYQRLKAAGFTLY